jgi:cytochrome P450
MRLYGHEFAGNVAGLYQEIRRRHGPVAPVLLDGDVPAWLVLGYRELHRVTSDSNLFARDSRRWNCWDLVPGDWPLMPYMAWAPTVIFAEGAEHRRRSSAISDALDAVDRTHLAAISVQIADSLIDEFVGDGAADLIAQYSLQVPTLAVARLFGLSDADGRAFARDISTSLNAGEDAAEAHQRVFGQMADVVAHKRRRPGPDLPSRMLAHPAELTDEEAAGDIVMVMLAGTQPTGGWIGNTLRLMLIDDQFSLSLQGGRSSAAQSLNEVLWKDTPTQNFLGRWAAQDCELGGRRIRRGDLLVLGLAAANLDPQVHPNSFAKPSTNRAHMSFCYGEHGCPAPAPELAEIIARTAVEVLLDRIPDVHLSVPADSLQWRPSVWMRGLESLPVQFTPVTRMVGSGAQTGRLHGVPPRALRRNGHRE